jgi:hypothetical protein
VFRISPSVIGRLGTVIISGGLKEGSRNMKELSRRAISARKGPGAFGPSVRPILENSTHGPRYLKMESEYDKDRFPDNAPPGPEATLFNVSTRSFTMADALGMAEFLGDYSPNHLFSGTVQGRGGDRPALHPFRIACLVDLAVRVHLPGCTVTRLVVTHRSAALVGDSLSVSAALLRRCEGEGWLDLEFRVSTGHGRTVASGSARVSATVLR